MKAIFLDVDGVLNFVGTDAKSPSGYRGIVDKLVDNLSYVVKNTGAIIVLSSSWRHDISLPALEPISPEGRYLINKLKRHGLHLSSKTDDYARSRPHAIIEWIQNNTMEGELTHWVVLDDEIWLYDNIDSIAPQEFMQHVVITNEASGLTKENADKAIEILTE